MRKVISAVFLSKNRVAVNVTRQKIDENLLWDLVKFKDPGKG